MWSIRRSTRGESDCREIVPITYGTSQLCVASFHLARFTGFFFFFFSSNSESSNRATKSSRSRAVTREMRRRGAHIATRYAVRSRFLASLPALPPLVPRYDCGIRENASTFFGGNCPRYVSRQASPWFSFNRGYRRSSNPCIY